MASRIVITDFAKFDLIRSNFLTGIFNLENGLEKQNTNFDNIKRKDIWRGDLQEAVSDKYDELSNNYETIIDSLKTLDAFMLQTLNSYRVLVRNNENAQIENSNEFTVNS